MEDASRDPQQPAPQARIPRPESRLPAKTQEPKRGGEPGNQNARKRGLYDSALPPP